MENQFTENLSPKEIKLLIPSSFIFSSWVLSRILRTGRNDVIFNKVKLKQILKSTKLIKKINLIKFKQDFEILSVLRNLKIIGIFTRLAYRDNKKKYTQLIPYAWKMIDYRLKQNKIFKDLKLLLKNNFPEFIN